MKVGSIKRAKGLEFKQVMLPWVAERLMSPDFPLHSSKPAQRSSVSTAREGDTLIELGWTTSPLTKQTTTEAAMAMNGAQWFDLLKAAVGPVLTAVLLLLVINQVASRTQLRRDAAESREALATEMTESANSLYFGLQKFWREAAQIPVSKRRTTEALKDSFI